MLELLDGPQIAAQAKMIRTKFGGSILIVEGPTDQRLLERFVEAEHCVVVCAYGKANVLGAVDLLRHEDFAGTIGFVDADFDRIDGRDVSGPNVVVCDHADSEMMLLASPAFDKVVAEYGSVAKVDAFLGRSAFDGVREHLFEEAAKLAMVRHANLQQDWGLRFRDLAFGKFVHVPSLALELEKAVRQVVAASKKPGLAPEGVLNSLPASPPGHDRSEYCAGHDCTQLLALGLRQALASHPRAVANRENVERLLRLAYEWEYFVRTGVCAAIREWEQANSPYRVLVAS